MFVVFQTNSDLAAALHNVQTKHLAQELNSLVRQYHATIQPTFPSVEDPELQTYFVAEVADATDAERLAKKLLKTNGIEAAYVKPRDEAP